MNLDVSPAKFQSMSNEKKKTYIAKLLIRESNSIPVEEGQVPVAIIMAGLPGAGKTEFLESISELILQQNKHLHFVRIDLDQIVTVYPDYSPKDYYKFRSRGNVVISRCIDTARKERHNIMIDGTFSGASGASLRTIEKLLDSGYKVQLVYMYDKAKTAWHFTQQREKETNRGVSKEGFIAASTNLITNLKQASIRFSNHEDFSIFAVLQKQLRDKNYIITSQRDKVDNMLDKTYNVSEL
jgi:predicted ABC-type ATPase